MKLNQEQIGWHNQAKLNFEKNVLTEIEEKNSDKSFDDGFIGKIKALDEHSTLTICKGQNIPNGFVIIGQTTSFSCSDNLNNAWIIKRPGNQETVCKSSPIPDGYVIIGQTTNFSFSNNMNNAWTIKKV